MEQRIVEPSAAALERFGAPAEPAVRQPGRRVRAGASSSLTGPTISNWNRTGSAGWLAKGALRAVVSVAVGSGDNAGGFVMQGVRQMRAPERWIRRVRVAILFAAASLSIGSALAQQPTQAQANAIKQACRADYPGTLRRRADRRIRPRSPACNRMPRACRPVARPRCGAVGGGSAGSSNATAAPPPRLRPRCRDGRRCD